MTRARGSVLIFVLVMLAALGMLGATLSQHASWRWLAAAEYRERLCGPEPEDGRWHDGGAPCDHRKRREQRVVQQ